MPKIILKDIELGDYNLSPRISNLREIYMKAIPEICIERPKLMTKFYLDNDFFHQERLSILDKARTYRYVLENRRAIVYHTQAHDKHTKPFEFTDNSLFAGSTTSKLKGVPLYPEYFALAIWSELLSISKKECSPFYIDNSYIEELDENIFHHWMGHSIIEIGRKRCYEENKDKYGLKKSAPEFELLESLIFFLIGKPNGISHTIPDFSKVIKIGIKGMIDEAKEREEYTKDPSKKLFYNAIIEVLEGIISYSRRLSSEVRCLAENETDPTRKNELLLLAEINQRVPENPAKSFHEALAAIWVCWKALHLENGNTALSLGRLDQILYEIYCNDIDSGRIDVADAMEMLCCFWLKIGDHVPFIPEAMQRLFGGSASNQAITIGGVDEYGNDAVNDLTYVMLRSIELMKLPDPNANARYYSGVNSKEYIKRLCSVNINTGAMPAIHNDKAVIKSLTSKGETIQQARDYGIIGCVEPGSNGRFYGHSGAILVNLASVLELTLFNGRHRQVGLDSLISKETGKSSSFGNFDDFKFAFESQLKWIAEQSTKLNDMTGGVHQDFCPTPILSSFFEGPMEKGKDLTQGGATINSSGVTIVGFADVVDSLSAIQKLVFDERSISLSDLIDAIKRDFEGYEVIHKRLVNPNKIPKFGNEDPYADANALWLVEMVDNTFNNMQNYRGGKYRVGYWSMTNHVAFGRLMPATPNGRKNGDSFSSGITPVFGIAPSLTKKLNSIANLPAKFLSNGIALNIKYMPEYSAKEQTLDNLVGAVEGYFDDCEGRRDGGMEIQFNIASQEIFRDAMKHPEKYPELLVRVSGYTAYFANLDPHMQREIVERTQYLSSDGQITCSDIIKEIDRTKVNACFSDVLPSAKNLWDNLYEVAINNLLKAMLRIMNFPFRLSNSCQKTIADFKGKYLFETSDGAISINAYFMNGAIKLNKKTVDDWDVRIEFKNAKTLRKFMSPEHDIVDSILDKSVKVEGNLNYVHKFAFVARNIVRNLHLGK